MHAAHALSFTALLGLPEIDAGADLAQLILAALHAQALSLSAHDVLVIAQKIVSKAEGRAVLLDEVIPSPEARRLAALTAKDPRLVELILAESHEIVRAAPNVLIARHRLGHVMANAGVDRSNVPRAGEREQVLLLPLDPDRSAAQLQQRLQQIVQPLGVIISDSFGRPWRLGATNVAIGAAGVPALLDRRGERDRNGRALQITEVALADAIAAGAGAVMGEGAESTPVVLLRGLDLEIAAERNARSLLRPLQQDLFR
ncbi:MAG TPA: coenzyme F420-0:L-glutamate ligase [Steroidobacteraceae bacterium]|nr:coenzyme F420-0:L-glutamate ligase [Steroidobacteraceae bacterium]